MKRTAAAIMSLRAQEETARLLELINARLSAIEAKLGIPQTVSEETAMPENDQEKAKRRRRVDEHEQ